MTRYELIGGYYTEIMFVKTKEGIVPFPSANAKMVKEQGTPLSKTHLKETIGEKRYNEL